MENASWLSGATVVMTKELLLNAFISWHKVLAVVVLYLILHYSCLGSGPVLSKQAYITHYPMHFFKSDLFIDFSEKTSLDDVVLTLLPQALNASPAHLIPHL